jgi:hypothetical protein
MWRGRATGMGREGLKVVSDVGENEALEYIYGFDDLFYYDVLKRGV